MVEDITHIGQLVPDPRNSRRHNPRNIGMLEDALHEVGAARSIVIDEGGTILAGNGVIEAAAQAGIERVQVVDADGETIIAVRRSGLTAEQKVRLSLFDNRASDLSDFDPAVLADLAAESDKLLSGLWSETELAALLEEASKSEAGEDPGPQLDRAEELREKWGCKRGDLWTIPSLTVPGRSHRLLCGDSTSEADVARLMGGERAALCFTSPPYAKQREYEHVIEDWNALMQGGFGNLVMTQEGQVLVNLGLIYHDGEWWPYWDGWIEWMRSQGWRRFGWYVWDQGPALPGDWSGRLGPSHEFIFHFNRVAKQPNKTVPNKNAGEPNHGRGLRKADGTIGEKTHINRPVQAFRIPDDVLRISRHKARGIEVAHPAVFPPELAGEILSAFSGVTSGVHDPFLGSGTTMVAAEQTSRICYGMEISEKYCGVILERMLGMGLSPAPADG